MWRDSRPIKSLVRCATSDCATPGKTIKAEPFPPNFFIFFLFFFRALWWPFAWWWTFAWCWTFAWWWTFGSGSSSPRSWISKKYWTKFLRGFLCKNTAEFMYFLELWGVELGIVQYSCLRSAWRNPALQCRGKCCDENTSQWDAAGPRHTGGNS